jgi:periplasmic divalent cation tolerance protein
MRDAPFSSRGNEVASPVTDARVVLVSVPSEADGIRLARLLVQERLVACGSVMSGVTSIYRWEGEVREEREHLLVLKSDRSRTSALLRRIPGVHPYEVPEILVLEVEAGHRPYLEWIAAETHERQAEES